MGVPVTASLKTTDPCTDIILDFIAGGVPGNKRGESGGNYNAVIGEPNATDDLGKLTINQVYSLQDRLHAMGRPSTAVGRYQIIKPTLQALVHLHQIHPTSWFDPPMQDRLGMYLLIGRGYHLWWTGKMSAIGMAHGLSLEWASLPDPENGGKSHYDHDAAGNHASTKLATVYAMLKRARAAIRVAV